MSNDFEQLYSQLSRLVHNSHKLSRLPFTGWCLGGPCALHSAPPASSAPLHRPLGPPVPPSRSPIAPDASCTQASRGVCVRCARAAKCAAAEIIVAITILEQVHVAMQEKYNFPLKRLILDREYKHVLTWQKNRR